MLSITVPTREYFDEKTGEFIYVKGQTLQLEHSLVSLSKWESKWCRSFISSKQEKTIEETIDYIKCMTITQNVDPLLYNNLTNENIQAINEYIAAPMTATYFPQQEDNKKLNGEPITSELIYYWMVALTIPFECQKWHLNRLITLIRVCNLKNSPPKKTNKRELANRYAAINEARKKKLNTKG
jgi:hypothetical protein